MNYKQKITADFISRVEALIENNVVKDYSEIVEKLKWDKSSMSNVISKRRNVPVEIYERLKKEYDLKDSFRNENKEQKNEPFDLSGIDSSQPIIQVVLNLTYIGRKNAETIDKMAAGVNTIAATNQRNTDIIAALVAQAFPNSKLAAELTASLVGQHTDDDLPIEAFLGGQEGIDRLKAQKQGGKETVKSK